MNETSASARSRGGEAEMTFLIWCFSLLNSQAGPDTRKTVVMTGLGYLSNDGLILSRLRARLAAQGVELVELPREPRESARSLEVEEESRLYKFASEDVGNEYLANNTLYLLGNPSPLARHFSFSEMRTFKYWRNILVPSVQLQSSPTFKIHLSHILYLLPVSLVNITFTKKYFKIILKHIKFKLIICDKNLKARLYEILSR